MNNRSLFRRVLLSLIFLASFSFCSCFGLIELPKKFSYPSPVARTQSSQNNVVAKTDVKPVAQSMTSQDGDGKEVTLVVSGSAPTEKEATLIALRSAIEQTFGTFVSANTEMLNDDIIKDEIVSVSKGNIKNYEKLSSTILPNGQTSVSLKTTVSISKLISYAKSKGSTAEFAGQTFTMNMKIRKLEKENEDKTINMLMNQILQIARKGIYDYKVTTGDPSIADPSEVNPSISENVYKLPIRIEFVPNKNYVELKDCVTKTLEGVSIPKSEIDSYEKVGLKTYPLHLFSSYVLRNDCGYLLVLLKEVIRKLSHCSFHLSDNLRSSISPNIKKEWYGEYPRIDYDIIGYHSYFVDGSYVYRQGVHLEYGVENPCLLIEGYFIENDMSNLSKIEVSFDQSLMNSFIYRLKDDGKLTRTELAKYYRKGAVLK